MPNTFLYFVPNVSDPASAKKADKYGIGYAFDGLPVVAQVPGNGPGGTSGMLLWNRGTDEVHGYYPAKQTWKRVPGSVAHFGWYNDALPKPADLERKSALAGHPVELGDGNYWTCPAARHWEEQEGGSLVPTIAAPHSYTVNDEGDWTIGEIVPRYAALWKVAQRYFDLIAGAAESDSGFDFTGGNDAALECLSTNYRVSKGEVSALNLFNGNVIHPILEAAADLPTYKILEKKRRDAAGLNSTDGPTD